MILILNPNNIQATIQMKILFYFHFSYVIYKMLWASIGGSLLVPKRQIVLSRLLPIVPSFGNSILKISANMELNSNEYVSFNSIFVFPIKNSTKNVNFAL